jgi:hypothetical protein
MPRDKHSSQPDDDDRVHLPAHILVMMVVVLLFFIGVGGILVYSSMNHTVPPRLLPLPRYTLLPAPRRTPVLQRFLALHHILLLPLRPALQIAQ